MATAFEAQRSSSQHAELSFEDRLGLLVDTEWTARESRKLTQRLRHAKLRYPASLEDIDFSTPRGLSREVVLSLDTGGWIRDHPSSADHRANRHRQVVAGVGLRPKRLSPRLHRDVCPGAAAPARSRRQSRRRLVWPAARQTGQARSPGHR